MLFFLKLDGLPQYVLILWQEINISDTNKSHCCEADT